MQELEDYAITKARETTHKVNDCVRAAEAIREDATQTMLTLHRQGEQIMRSHQVAADIEQDLTVVSSQFFIIGYPKYTKVSSNNYYHRVG